MGRIAPKKNKIPAYSGVAIQNIWRRLRRGLTALPAARPGRGSTPNTTAVPGGATRALALAGAMRLDGATASLSPALAHPHLRRAADGATVAHR